MKHAWIRKHRDAFPVAASCRVLEVSTSGYHHALDRQPSQRAARHARILDSVAAVHAESHGIYGSVKVAKELNNRDDLEHACRNTAAKAMRELGLKSRIRKSFTPTTTRSDPHQQPAPNKLDRNFTADQPNRKWVTDITYLATTAGWVYLAAVVDLYSRKVIGWAISNSLATELVAAALRQAIEHRRPDCARLLHHSDRGCQYTSDGYQWTLKTLGIECSMSRTGECYDNAVMERFFWSLKHEWTNHASYQNLEDAKLGVFKYIETFYNSKRLHQTLGYCAPDEFEKNPPPAKPSPITKPADHAPAVAA